MDEFSFTQEPKEGQIGSTDLHQLSDGSPQKISTKDFKFIRMLGKGSFGKVYFATSHDSGKNYAIKVLREKEVLKRSDNPFIVKLFYSFQDRSSLYFCLELVTGGMLFSRLKHQKKFSLEETVFYASEFDVQLKVMYRDLKPENILIGEDGHIKLTDFGVSHLGLNRTKTMCGTMEYLPPEVILNQEYDHVADYWSFGILIYEMLLGKTPFEQYKKSDSLLFKAICVGTISMPAKWSDVTKSFIRGLLTTDPNQRLGAKGIHEIKNHPFFKGVNFEEVAQLKSVPPFVPEPFDFNAPTQGSPLVCSDAAENRRQAEYDDFEFARKSFEVKAVSARTDSSGEQTVKAA